MFVGGGGHLSYYFHTKLNIDSHELIERFKKNQDVDIANLIFYSEAEYTDVLREHSPNSRMFAEMLEKDKASLIE